MEAANALEFCYKNLTLAEFDRMDSDLRHNKAFFVTTLFGCDCLRCCGFVEIVDVFSSSASAMSTSALSVSCTAENLLSFTQVRRRSNHSATLEGKTGVSSFLTNDPSSLNLTRTLTVTLILAPLPLPLPLSLSVNLQTEPYL
jgi:hypothetical protein